MSEVWWNLKMNSQITYDFRLDQMELRIECGLSFERSIAQLSAAINAGSASSTAHTAAANHSNTSWQRWARPIAISAVIGRRPSRMMSTQ